MAVSEELTNNFKLPEPFGRLSSHLQRRAYLAQALQKRTVFARQHKTLADAVTVYLEKFRVLLLLQSRRLLDAYRECLDTWPAKKDWLKPRGLAVLGKTRPVLTHELSFELVALDIVWNALCPIAHPLVGSKLEKQFPGKGGYPSFSKCVKWTKENENKLPREIVAAFQREPGLFKEVSSLRDEFPHKDTENFVGMDPKRGLVFKNIPIVFQSHRDSKAQPQPILPTIRSYLRAHLETAFKIEAYACGWCKMREEVDASEALSNWAVGIEDLLDPQTETFGVEKYSLD